jgi:hypothetical protein
MYLCPGVNLTDQSRCLVSTILLPISSSVERRRSQDLYLYLDEFFSGFALGNFVHFANVSSEFFYDIFRAEILNPEEVSIYLNIFYILLSVTWARDSGC